MTNARDCTSPAINRSTSSATVAGGSGWSDSSTGATTASATGAASASSAQNSSSTGRSGSTANVSPRRPDQIHQLRGRHDLRPLDGDRQHLLHRGGECLQVGRIGGEHLVEGAALRAERSRSRRRSAGSRRCCPRPRRGAAWVTTSDSSPPSASVTARSALGVAGRATIGRRSTPTASPSSELDRVTTPTTNMDAAATTRSTIPMNPISVLRLRLWAIAVTAAPGTASAPGSRRAPVRSPGSPGGDHR